MATPDKEMDTGTLSRVLAESELIHSPGAVQRALDRMAAAVTERLGGSDPVLVAVMTGGMIPAVWLGTRLSFPHQLDYAHATRYVGSTRGGNLRWRARPRLPLAGRVVLVVDDILDEGITLREIAAYCREQGASQVLTAVLVRKQHDRAVGGAEADFVGLEVPDRYVFGCGMDYHEYFRELTGIYALPAEMEDGI
jgi:hypoxanthine phosphoribosyltransferase